MQQHHGAAPVELAIDLLEIGVAGRAVVVAGEVHEPVEADVLAALDLGQAVVDIGEGERGEGAEAASVAGDQPGEVVVAAPRQLPAGRPVAVIEPGGGKRQDRGGDPQPVHQGERDPGRPVGERAVGGRRIAARGLRVAEEPRQHVMVNVDAVLSHAGSGVGCGYGDYSAARGGGGRGRVQGSPARTRQQSLSSEKYAPKVNSASGGSSFPDALSGKNVSSPTRISVGVA